MGNSTVVREVETRHTMLMVVLSDIKNFYKIAVGGNFTPHRHKE